MGKFLFGLALGVWLVVIAMMVVHWLEAARMSAPAKSEMKAPEHKRVTKIG